MNNRICMIVYAYYFTDARVKSYVKCLAKRGFKIDILALKEPGKNAKREKISSKITIYYLTDKYTGKNIYAYIWSYFKFFISVFWELNQLWFKNKYRIIHIHNMPNFIIFSAIIPKIFGCKLILDMHDIMSLNFQSKYGDKNLSNLLAFEEKVSVFFANKLICADHFQKNFLVNKRKINKSKISVIMNFPDISVFRFNGRKQQNNSVFNIVYHGTVASRLGVDLILKAIAKVKDVMPVKFFLYGTGDAMGECLKVIERENLQDNVFSSKRFFSVEDLPDLLKYKELGIIGNRNLTIAKYLLPVKMIEYMATGIPVIAPRLKNISYYFKENMVCFYKPEDIDDLADKIILLYNSPKKRKELSDRAFAYIKENNWKHEFNKYMEIINEFTK